MTSQVSIFMFSKHVQPADMLNQQHWQYFVMFENNEFCFVVENVYFAIDSILKSYIPSWENWLKILGNVSKIFGRQNNFCFENASLNIGNLLISEDEGMLFKIEQFERCNAKLSLQFC